MKTIRTIIVILISFLLVGCSNEKEEATVIKIGGSGPLTGGAAQYGFAVQNGAQLAIDEINAKGGIHFEFKFLDDAHDAETAVTSYNSLKDWGMQISIATTTSTPGAAVSPLYNEDHIFALTPSASSNAVTLRDINDPSSYFGNIFQMCFTDPAQGSLSARYIAENKLATKIAIIYKNDDNYSKGIYQEFIDEAAKRGLQVVYTGTFDDSNASDFSVTVKASKDSGAELLFLPIYFEPASLILKQAQAIGYKPIFFGVDGMDGILGLDNFDKSLAEGVYLLTPFAATATDELTSNFVKNYEAKYGSTPIQFAADAYDCIYAIYQAVLAREITPSMEASAICDILISQFSKMTFVGTTGESTWNVNGEVNKVPKAVIITNGVYQPAQ